MPERSAGAIGAPYPTALDCRPAPCWTASASDDSEAPLLERARETAEIKALLQSVCEGRGRTVLIEAHAGLGKSRLLAEAAGRAAGLETLRGARGLAGERVPVRVAIQLLERALHARPPGPRVRAARPAPQARPTARGILGTAAAHST